MDEEIERKFKFLPEKFKDTAVKKVFVIEQQYILYSDGEEARVRIKDDKAYLTIKSTQLGITRKECNVEISVDDAKHLMKMFGKGDKIKKIRSHAIYENRLWEIDEFKGVNEGLTIAEIELENEKSIINLPPWVGEEVTYDRRYRNSYIAEHPYSEW